jgi:hypothetical protein
LLLAAGWVPIAFEQNLMFFVLGMGLDSALEIERAMEIGMFVYIIFVNDVLVVTMVYHSYH